MERISLTPFLMSKAKIFDLHGHTNGPRGVPCRVKVGPRRILDTRVDPDRFTLDFWCAGKEQVTYLRGQPIPQERDQDGVLFFDAEAFLQKYLGGDYCLCNNDNFRRKKEHLGSDTFLTTEYGAASSLISWTDFPMVYSYLYFAPGALTLCGRNVRSISWETFNENYAASGDAVRSLVEKLLSGPHDLTLGSFLKPLRRVRDLTFNYLWIQTDQGSCTVTTTVGEPLSVTLKGKFSEECIAASTEPLKVLKLGLMLLGAADRKAARRTLNRLYRQGRAAPVPEPEE